MILIFKLFLVFVGFSVGTSVLASVFNWLELAALASILHATAFFSWLSAYLIISLQTVYLILKSTWRQLQYYFNSSSKIQRQLLFKQNRHAQLKKLHTIQRQHLSSLYEAKRLKLLRANDKKHHFNPSKLTP
ncbi:MAG: hypothetical protein RQ733_04670 [Methyloprofundus sp.]|nr:hypothetical protein [Methyloprofundus sp.]